MAKDTAEEERLRQIDARKRDTVTETAKRDVGMALKAPGKAHLAREGLQSASGWGLTAMMSERSCDANVWERSKEL